MDQLIKEILKHEGPAPLVTKGTDEIHLVSSWNSYIECAEPDKLLFPAGGFNKTEKNIALGSKVQMLIGSKEVQGKRSMGTGFRLEGRAEFVYEGEIFDKTKQRFPWARAVVVFTIEKSEQLL